MSQHGPSMKQPASTHVGLAHKMPNQNTAPTAAPNLHSQPHHTTRACHVSAPLIPLAREGRVPPVSCVRRLADPSPHARVSRATWPHHTSPSPDCGRIMAAASPVAHSSTRRWAPTSSVRLGPSRACSQASATPTRGKQAGPKRNGAATRRTQVDRRRMAHNRCKRALIGTRPRGRPRGRGHAAGATQQGPRGLPRGRPRATRPTSSYPCLASRARLARRAPVAAW